MRRALLLAVTVGLALFIAACQFLPPTTTPDIPLPI